MKNRFISYLISSVLLSTLACSQQQQADKAEAAARLPVTVGVIEQSVKEIGGKATVPKYLCAQNPETDDFTALDNISAGSKEWVALAVKMLPYSDAACAESLLSSLGDAMQKQPRNVLPYVGQSKQLSADQICMPFISGELPKAEILRQIRVSKASVQSVSDAALSKQCAACLERIESSEKRVMARSDQPDDQ